jgi:1-acyl-sn-glycerol-3-phosphate acyltransferase
VNEENLHLEEGPFVIVSNHGSLYDIPVLFASLPLRIRMAAKRELFSTPIWGTALESSGFVQIDRSSPEAAYGALHAAGNLMRERGMSLYIAPEGTRSRDGCLGKFKKGAFDLAQTTGLPILPLAIFDTRKIHSSGSVLVHRGQSIRLKILRPIPAKQIVDLVEAAANTEKSIEQALLELSRKGESI